MCLSSLMRKDTKLILPVNIKVQPQHQKESMADIHQLKGVQRCTMAKPIAASHTDTLPYSSDYRTPTELHRPTSFKTSDIGKNEAMRTKQTK